MVMSSSQSDDGAEMLIALKAAQDKAAKQVTEKIRRILTTTAEPAVKECEQNAEDIFKGSEKRLNQIIGEHNKKEANLIKERNAVTTELFKNLEQEMNAAQQMTSAVKNDTKHFNKSNQKVLTKFRNDQKDEEALFDDALMGTKKLVNDDSSEGEDSE